MSYKKLIKKRFNNKNLFIIYTRMTEYLQDTSDEKIIELANDLYELYTNPDIINYTHNGKSLPFKYQSLISRSIPGIYSNIEKKPSIQRILANAIKLSLNMSTQTKNTNELKIYRESCERFKMSLSLLMRKKQQGIQVDETDIENKTREIKMLEQKMNEIATAATFRPEINKKILTNAVTIYNVMLRNDRVPKILFIKFCKKIGYNFNYTDRFVDEYDKSNSINGIPLKQKPGTYVPPAFRSENTIKSNIIKNEDEDEKSDLEDNNQIQTSTSKIKNNNIKVPIYVQPVNKNIGMWANKSNLIFNTDNDNNDKNDKNDKNDNNKNDKNDKNKNDNDKNKNDNDKNKNNNVDKKEDKNKIKTNSKSKLKLSNEWEVNDDF